MTEGQKVRQLLVELLNTQGIDGRTLKWMQTEVRLAGYDSCLVEGELETCEALGYVSRSAGGFGVRWAITEQGKEALK